MHFQAAGTTQVVKEKLKRYANGDEMTCDAILINLGSMLSGPGPLLEDSVLMACRTSPALTCLHSKTECVVD